MEVWDIENTDRIKFGQLKDPEKISIRFSIDTTSRRPRCELGIPVVGTIALANNIHIQKNLPRFATQGHGGRNTCYMNIENLLKEIEWYL